MVNKGGNRYKYGPKIYVDNQADIDEYLAPEKYIQSDNENIIKLSDKINKDSTTDMEKAKGIYSWVTQNIKYDYDKYKKQTNQTTQMNYGALEDLKDDKGICFDYAALTTALGRAAGLKVKLVSGYIIVDSHKMLHNWNEIYISELGRWISVDTSYGVTARVNAFDSTIFSEQYSKN